MDRIVSCQACGHVYAQDLPNVSIEEAQRLRADMNDVIAVFQCVRCQAENRVLHWSIPHLPEYHPSVV